jgi:hypothetical protein
VLAKLNKNLSLRYMLEDGSFDSPVVLKLIVEGYLLALFDWFNSEKSNPQLTIHSPLERSQHRNIV